MHEDKTGGWQIIIKRVSIGGDISYGGGTDSGTYELSVIFLESYRRKQLVVRFSS
jgi:hypothetical protein